MATSDQNPYQPPREETKRYIRVKMIAWRRSSWLGSMIIGSTMVFIGIRIALPNAEGHSVDDFFSAFLFIAGVTLCLVGSLITTGSVAGWWIQSAVNRLS